MQNNSDIHQMLYNKEKGYYMILQEIIFFNTNKHKI